MAAKDKPNSRTFTIGGLQSEVRTMLHDFTQQGEEQADQLRENLSQNKQNRAQDVAETLIDFARKRAERADQLREQLADDETKRTEEVSETLRGHRTQQEQLRQQLREDLAANQADRATDIAEILRTYAGYRGAMSHINSHNLQADRMTLMQEVTQLLQTFEAEHAAEAQELRQNLASGNNQRQHEVEEFLKETSAKRQAVANAQAERLRQENHQRVAQVQGELAELREQRASVQSGTEPRTVSRPAAVKQTGATQPRPKASAKPIAPKPTAKPKATPAQYLIGPKQVVETREERAGTGQIAADELFLYLIDFPGSLSLEELENRFGSSRLYNHWEDFMSLVEELRPGSRLELESWRARRGGRKDKKIGDVMPFLALHPDGVTIEELEQNFEANRNQLESYLRKLSESGKVRKNGKVYLAI